MNTAEEIFRGALRRALGEIVREDWDAMTQASGPAIPKDRDYRRYRREVKSLLREGPGRTPHPRLVKAAAILIGTIVSLFALGMAIQPVRAAVLRYAIRAYDTHVGVRYDADEPVPSIIEEVVLPAWLPDGWTLETNFATDYLVTHTILDAARDRIMLDQHIIKPDAETDWFDNRDLVIESVLLNGRTEARLFTSAGRYLALTWTDGYVFTLKTNSDAVDADMLIRIAESMEHGS